MTRNIVVVEANGISVNDMPVEIVERKGIGHPDSICDGIAERVSVKYTRWCKEKLNLDKPLHHNFDKVQLVAGEAYVGFNEGYIIKPIRIQIAGRGMRSSPDGRKVPLDMIAINAAKEHIRNTMKNLKPEEHCIVECYAGEGSNELINQVKNVTANDTSFGASHWPFSDLEKCVYETSQYLNFELIKKYPIGEDTKVMGARIDNKVTLTCSVPIIGPEITNIEEYIHIKTELRNMIHAFASNQSTKEILVTINTGDDEKTGEVYLTVTGTSAEQGDDGSVGRGNRVNGLITPFHPTSLEAACGKNPISHVGKIYNVLSLNVARSIIEQIPVVFDVQVYILSQIGKPLDEPLIATAVIRTKDNFLDNKVKKAIMNLINEELNNIDEVSELITNGQITLF